jgi:hypothetical protein
VGRIVRALSHFTLESAVGWRYKVRNFGREFISGTVISTSMPCKVLVFHGGDHEEFRLLGYKNEVLTSLETYYVSTTETSQLNLCKI